MYNSAVKSNTIEDGRGFCFMIMHTREKLGKQANKEQLRISSHFIVYSISRELNYIKKTLQNSMLLTSQKNVQNS